MVEKLISQVALGDKTAFRSLFEQTSAKLLGICLRILRDRAEAEDALQDVYVKVWQKSETFHSSKASGMTWLASIARNQAIDRLRKRSPSSWTHDDDTVADIPDDTPSPEETSVAASDMRRVQACLDELEADRANAVKKTYLGGLTYREVAEELSIPLNTVKTWIRRSLVALRACLNR